MLRGVWIILAGLLTLQSIGTHDENHTVILEAGALARVQEAMDNHSSNVVSRRLSSLLFTLVPSQPRLSSESRHPLSVFASDTHFIFPCLTRIDYARLYYVMSRMFAVFQGICGMVCSMLARLCGSVDGSRQILDAGCEKHVATTLDGHVRDKDVCYQAIMFARYICAADRGAFAVNVRGFGRVRYS